MHLRERGNEKDALTYNALVGELDADFDKEYGVFMRELLWQKYGALVRKYA